MIHVQGAKKVALEPASYSAGAAASLQVDRLGFDYITFDALLGRVSNASNVPTIINLSESDDTNASNFATITGSSATASYTAGLTGAVSVITCDVTGVGRKRYIQLNVTTQATQVLSAVANLTRAENLPVTATQKNVAVWIVL